MSNLLVAVGGHGVQLVGNVVALGGGLQGSGLLLLQLAAQLGVDLRKHTNLRPRDHKHSSL